MNNQVIKRVLFVLALFSFTVSAWADEKPEFVEVYTGNALATGNIATGKSAFVRIRVTRWTTDEERELLLRILIEKGEEEMINLLQKQNPTGTIQVRGSLGYDLHYARQIEKDGKRRLVLATDRPMSFRELWRSGRNIDYSVSLIQLLLNPGGKEEGSIAAAVKLKFDPKDKTLEVENYGTDPIMIRGLKQEK